MSAGHARDPYTRTCKCQSFETPCCQATIIHSPHCAFRSAIVGYLALKNMLALASDNDLSSRLSSYTREEFTDWLDRIDRGGSVKG